jgi:hypothetical protein
VVETTRKNIGRGVRLYYIGSRPLGGNWLIVAVPGHDHCVIRRYVAGITVVCSSVDKGRASTLSFHIWLAYF